MSLHNYFLSHLTLTATEGLGTARFVALLRHIQETHQLEGCQFAKPHNLPRIVPRIVGILESALRTNALVLTGKVQTPYPPGYNMERDHDYYDLWMYFLTTPPYETHYDPRHLEEISNQVLEVLNRLIQNPQTVTDEELSFLVNLFDQYQQYLNITHNHICRNPSLSPLEPCAKAAGRTHFYKPPTITPPIPQPT